MNNESYQIERPARAVLIVKIKSQPFHGRALPDATFTFRVGDPQYDVWEARYLEQQKNLSTSNEPNEQ